MKAVLIRRDNDDEFAAEVKSKLDVIELNDAKPAKVVAKELGIPIITLIGNDLEDYYGLLLTKICIRHRGRGFESYTRDNSFFVLDVEKITEEMISYLNKDYYMTKDEYEICKTMGWTTDRCYIGSDIPTDPFDSIILKDEHGPFSIGDRLYYRWDPDDSQRTGRPFNYFTYLPHNYGFVLLTSNEDFDKRFTTHGVECCCVTIDLALKNARIFNVPIVTKKYDKKFDEFDNFVITEDAIYRKGIRHGPDRNIIYVGSQQHGDFVIPGIDSYYIPMNVYKICKGAGFKYSFEYVCDGDQLPDVPFHTIHTKFQHKEFKIDGVKYGWIIWGMPSQYNTYIRMVKDEPNIKDFGFCKIVDKKTLIWNDVSFNIPCIEKLNLRFIDILERGNYGEDMCVDDNWRIMLIRQGGLVHIKLIKMSTQQGTMRCDISMLMSQFMAIRDYLV